MESASESPSAWSDLMAVSDDSDLLSDEYITHKNNLSLEDLNDMTINQHNAPNENEETPSPLGEHTTSSSSSSSMSHLCPPLNCLSPISPPTEFKDETEDVKDGDESSTSTLESYSAKLSSLALRDSNQSVATTWKFQSNPPIQQVSHPIVRPKPTRLSCVGVGARLINSSTNNASSSAFQSTSGSHSRQDHLDSNPTEGPALIYSTPIDTLPSHSNNLVMEQVHEILNGLYAKPPRPLTQDSLSLTRRRKSKKSAVASTYNNGSVSSSHSSSKHHYHHNSFVINIRKAKPSSSLRQNGASRKPGASSASTAQPGTASSVETGHTKPLRPNRKHQLRLKRLKQTLCRLFTFKTAHMSRDGDVLGAGSSETTESVLVLDVSKGCFSERALPPVPGNSTGSAGAASDRQDEAYNVDFASSIEKVKDYGWYWGPISSEAAEKILSTEPDGSFIVRDSSDDHYIFSLTFKLNACVRHVRIEHYQGNFSFGSCTKFKSHTIVDFIENAVEHSRSGRYLFFLHRRPVLGPMRVQLLHPVSRFKQVQSLQHMCRFVILKIVRKDHINQLPLPDRLQAYLNSPHYYCESSEQLDC